MKYLWWRHSPTPPHDYHGCPPLEVRKWWDMYRYVIYIYIYMHICIWLYNISTLPESNILPLKIIGLEDEISFWVSAYFIRSFCCSFLSRKRTSRFTTWPTNSQFKVVKYRKYHPKNQKIMVKTAIVERGTHLNVGWKLDAHLWTSVVSLYGFPHQQLYIIPGSKSLPQYHGVDNDPRTSFLNPKDQVELTLL